MLEKFEFWGTVVASATFVIAFVAFVWKFKELRKRRKKEATDKAIGAAMLKKDVEELKKRMIQVESEFEAFRALSEKIGGMESAVKYMEENMRNLTISITELNKNIIELFKIGK